MAETFTDLGYRIFAGGTDNHLFIVDLRAKNITGRAAEIALEQAGITVSRSCIPFDPEKPWITSGIRIGTPQLPPAEWRRKKCNNSCTLLMKHYKIRTTNYDCKISNNKQKNYVQNSLSMQTIGT